MQCSRCWFQIRQSQNYHISRIQFLKYFLAVRSIWRSTTCRVLHALMRLWANVGGSQGVASGTVWASGCLQAFSRSSVIAWAEIYRLQKTDSLQWWVREWRNQQRKWEFKARWLQETNSLSHEEMKVPGSSELVNRGVFRNPTSKTSNNFYCIVEINHFLVLKTYDGLIERMRTNVRTCGKSCVGLQKNFVFLTWC